MLDEVFEIKGMHSETRLCQHFESRSLVGEHSSTKLTKLMYKPEAPFIGCPKTTKIQLSWDLECSSQHGQCRLID